MTFARPSGPITTPWKQPAADLARWAAGVLVALFLAASLLVAARRCAGALSQPLDTATVVFVSVLIATAAVLIRSLCRHFSPAQSRAVLLATFATSAAVLILGVALSVPGTSVFGLAAFWCVLVVEEVSAWGPVVRRARRLDSATRTEDPPMGETPVGETPAAETPVEIALPKPQATAPSVPSADESLDSAPAIEEPTGSDVDTVESRCNPELSPPGADVLQQLTRSKTADGTERLDGWLRMPLAPGQRTASVHVAFCPPFETNPTLDLEQIEGPEGRIRSAQLMPHGVRLDLKLRRKPEEPTDVFLRFSAVWSAAQDSP